MASNSNSCVSVSLVDTSLRLLKHGSISPCSLALQAFVHYTARNLQAETADADFAEVAPTPTAAACADNSAECGFAAAHQQ